MSDEISRLQTELTGARKLYLDDMRWLRVKFGIIPSIRAEHIGPVLWNALTALECQNSVRLNATLKAFRKFHRSVMKEVTWDQLEAAKKSLKKIRNTQKETFKVKLGIWNEASHYFTNFNLAPGKLLSENYRKALIHLAKL